MGDAFSIPFILSWLEVNAHHCNTIVIMFLLLLFSKISKILLVYYFKMTHSKWMTYPPRITIIRIRSTKAYLPVNQTIGNRWVLSFPLYYKRVHDFSLLFRTCMQKYASELWHNSTGSWIRQRISMNQLASKKPIESNSLSKSVSKI